MEAIKLKAKISSEKEIEWLDPLPKLPEGNVEVIIMYESKGETMGRELSPNDWPTLKGGKYRGETLRREEIYGDNGR